MPTIRHLDELCTELENILSYLDHVKKFFIANKTAHTTQIESTCKGILLTITGEM